MGIRAKLWVGAIAALAPVLLAAPFARAWAQSYPKLICISKAELRGEVTLAKCLAKGERLAVIDRYGIVHILTKEEAELTRAFNPQAFKTKAFSLQYQKRIPPMPPLP